MYPVFFEVFGLKIHAYGFMVSMGFLASLFWLHLIGPKRGVVSHLIYGLFLWILLSGLIGGRLLFVAVHLKPYMKNPLEVFMFWRGGFVLYGGILAALLACMIYSKAKNIPFLNLADIVTPCAFLGISLGRWGCFLVGDCYGIPAGESLPWAVRFPFNPDSLLPIELQDVPLHPTQVYMSLNALYLFLITMYILRRRSFQGQVFLAGLMLYAITRAFIEEFRGDHQARGFIGCFSTSQWISFGLVICVLLLYVWIKSRARALNKK